MHGGMCGYALWGSLWKCSAWEEREKEEAKIPRGALMSSFLPPLHRWRSLGSMRTYVCVCRVRVCLRRCQILPHNFGIFHWYTQSKPRTCANSFTDDRYSLARENKRKRTGGRVLGGFLLCMVRRYNACEGYTRELRARGSSMNNWDSCTGRRFVSSFRNSLLDEIYIFYGFFDRLRKFYRYNINIVPCIVVKTGTTDCDYVLLN